MLRGSSHVWFVASTFLVPTNMIFRPSHSCIRVCLVSYKHKFVSSIFSIINMKRSIILTKFKFVLSCHMLENLCFISFCLCESCFRVVFMCLARSSDISG